MVNRQSRSPGGIQKFEARARLGDIPSFAVDTGAAGRAAAQVGQSLSSRLGVMADDARQREGQLAGLTAGQRAGAGYLEMRRVEQAAEVRAGGLDQDIDAHIRAAAEKHGVSADALRVIARIESSGNPKAKNPKSSAGGLFQFVDGTASDYGLVDRFDPAQASDAAARLLKDNAAELKRVLGREPTTAELYLAHQQGAKGASRLLANPGARAADIVGADAVVLNGGRADMTAGDFAGIWLGKAGGTAPAPVAGKARASTAPADPAYPARLSTEPLALRRDGTVYGEARDAAAIRAYSWRVQAGLTSDIGAAYDQHKDDPAAFNAAIGEISQRYREDGSFDDPQMAEIFEAQLVEKTEAYRRDVSARQERRLAQEQAAAVAGGIDAMRGDLERQAYVLGASPGADELLSTQAGRAMAAIDSAVADGSLTPAQAAAEKARIGDTIANARVNGIFAALQSPAQKEAFALGLLDDWSQGKGPLKDMGLAQVKALSATLWSQARHEANQQTAAQKAEAGRLEGLIADDLASMAETGQGLALNGAPALRPDQVETILGADAVVAWQTARDQAREIWQAANGMEAESAAEIGQRLDLLQPEPGQIGFARQQAVAAETAKRAKEVLQERQADPLGQAHRAGIVELEPLDTTNGEALGASLEQRRRQAEAVADAYDMPVTVFRPDERSALATALLDNPEILPGFATTLRASMGDLAPQALAELSEAGPELAHSAGLALATGDISVAGDIARVLAGRRDGTMKAKLPTDGAIANAAQSVLGGAFAGNDQARAAAAGVAAILFEKEANALGFNPADVTKPDTPAAAAMARAVDRAVGGRVLNGEKWGGLISVNGQSTVAPSFLPAAALPSLLANIGDADLAALPPIGSGNGLPVRAEQLRGGRLVAVGDGVYRVALGDPAGWEPQWLTTPDGDFWTLDAGALQDARDTRPAAPGADTSDQARWTRGLFVGGSP